MAILKQEVTRGSTLEAQLHTQNAVGQAKAGKAEELRLATEALAEEVDSARQLALSEIGVTQCCDDR